MDLTGIKNVGIIGAGVAGLGTAKTLLAQGIRCTLFERNEIVGGVWAGGYYGFGVQVQKELYEFPDWPLPPDAENFTPGPVIQRYLADYAEQFGVTPHIRFKTTVTALAERPVSEGGWTLTYNDETGSHEEAFDLVVVSIGLYSNVPHMPAFPGQDRFRGEILHNSAFKSPEQLRDRKVVVLGLGKSATDAAVESARVASKTTVVYRRPHWPVPRKLAGILPFKRGMLHRLTITLLPLYQRPTRLERVVHTVGLPLVWIFWRLVELLLMVQCRLGSRFGTRESLLPAKPVEVDAFGESTMLPRPEFYRWARNGRIDVRCSEIAEYTPEGVALKNGRKLEADVVILGTGWETDYGFLPEPVRERLGFEDDGLYLYRQMIHPEVPGLVFIGHASTICSILTYNLQARWLGELIAGRHRLPSCEAMLREIEDMKAWKRKWMPYSGARGARLILHMQHYHDELLRDFGASPWRKTGILAPIKEVIFPYEPRDYRAIAAGDWRR
jgi:cation diffusion facilitator CzcD-associated flavoprotein CzcO